MRLVHRFMLVVFGLDEPEHKQEEDQLGLVVLPAAPFTGLAQQGG
jgi:hypothetical protein